MRIITSILLMIATVCTAGAQQVEIVKIADLQQIMAMNNDTTYVINFWATWCVPCVKEFPGFETLATRHKNEKVKVVMVSLDFKKGYDKTLAPFIASHPVAGRALLLDEPDYNSWINKVSPDWQGEIPVTLMVNNARKIHAFFNHDFTPESLEQTFTNTIKQ